MAWSEGKKNAVLIGLSVLLIVLVSYYLFVFVDFKALEGTYQNSSGEIIDVTYTDSKHPAGESLLFKSRGVIKDKDDPSVVTIRLSLKTGPEKTQGRKIVRNSLKYSKLSKTISLAFVGVADPIFKKISV